MKKYVHVIVFDSPVQIPNKGAMAQLLLGDATVTKQISNLTRFENTKVTKYSVIKWPKTVSVNYEILHVLCVFFFNFICLVLI